RVTDSIFLNYWWDQQKLENSAQHAQELGLDPRAAVFTGVEAGKYQFEQPYDLADNLDADGAPLTAIATLGADFTHADLEGETDIGRHDEALGRARRCLTEAPAGESSEAEDAGQGNTGYISSPTVITGTSIDTGISSGHGLGYWRGGEKVGTTEWGNIGVQD